MPMFDFQCKCGHLFEELVPLKQKIRKCPVCGKLARRRPFPRRLALRTETQYAAAYGTLQDQCGGDAAETNRLTRAAMRAGYRPSAGDIYEPAMARFRGDPAAFLPADQAKSRIKRHCAEHEIGCEGRLEIPTPTSSRPPAKNKKMAADLVEEQRRKRIRQDPGLKDKDQNELRQEIIHDHGAPDDWCQEPT